jgi:hypothetical protein
MEIVCDRVDGTFITEFRKWSAAVPVVEGKKNPTTRERSPGTTEASVRTLAAVINFAHHRRETAFKAGFTAKPPSSVSRTPTYRATVEELAAMFRYCIEPRARGNEPEWSEKMIDRQRLFRRNLLRFLQISVATWCRPDAAHDVSTKRERDQWLSNAQVLQLNPRGRTQTKKYRPAVPVPARSARLLDRTNGFYVTVGSVRKAFEAMLDELQLLRDRETGLKLIAAACRRSCAGGSGGALGAGPDHAGPPQGHDQRSLCAVRHGQSGRRSRGDDHSHQRDRSACSGGIFPVHTGLAPEITIVGAAPKKGKT